MDLAANFEIIRLRSSDREHNKLQQAPTDKKQKQKKIAKLTGLFAASAPLDYGKNEKQKCLQIDRLLLQYNIGRLIDR